MPVNDRNTPRSYFIDQNSKGVFDTGSGKLSDNTLDLPAKLSILLKRGLGGQYVTVNKNLDAPTKVKHQQFMMAQFAKVTYDRYIKAMALNMDRKRAFEDFNAMEYTPEIASALDIYADESLTKNEYGDVLEIQCDNSRVKNVLENLFHDILDVDHNLWHWTRNVCKYGDNFILLDVQEARGIVGHMELSPREMRREEAYDGNINSIKFVWETQDLTFDNWQVAHFRLTEDQTKLPYGTSSLESARLIWKQLTLAEDAMIVYRTTRAPERRVFYIDVGNIDPGDVDQYINDVKNAIKRTPQVKETTGNIDFRYNAMAVDEDIFIPRRNDKNSEVDTLPGASNLDDIADIEYLQAKLFAALKIPKAYLTFDEDINAKATLSTEDFRFARTINRIQQSLIVTLNQMAVIHLYSLGLREKDQLTSFELVLTNPSTQSEIEQLEIWSQKADVFGSMWDPDTMSPISWVWGMKNIFDFSDDEVRAIAKQQFIEGKMKMEIETASMGDQSFGDLQPEDMGELPPEEDVFPQEDIETETTGTTETTETEPQKKYYGDDNKSYLENIDKMLDVVASMPQNIKTRSLINNSLSIDKTVKMLENMETSLENDEKKPLIG